MIKSITPQIPYFVPNGGGNTVFYVGLMCDGIKGKQGCTLPDAPVRKDPSVVNGTYILRLGTKDGKYEEDFTLIFNY